MLFKQWILNYIRNRSRRLHGISSRNLGHHHQRPSHHLRRKTTNRQFEQINRRFDPDRICPGDVAARGALLFAVGIIHMLNYLNVIRLSGIAVYFPVGVIGLNLLTFVLVALLKHRSLFSIIAFQMVAFTIIIILQILSIT